MLLESLSNLNPGKPYAYLKSSDLTYKLLIPSTSIGRDPDSDIVLNHPSISKKHAVIDYDSEINNAFITDLNSTYGTFLNESKISENTPMKLTHGDILTFGQSETKYTYLLSDEKKIEKNFLLKDNKISLVNDNDYKSASINHFNNNNNNPFLNNIDNNNNNEDIVNNGYTIEFNDNKFTNVNNNNNLNDTDDNIEEVINSQDNFIKNIPMAQIVEETNPDLQSNTLLVSSNNLQQKNILPNNNYNNEGGNSLYQELYNKKNLLENELKAKNSEIKTVTDLYNELQDKYNKLNAKHNALMIYASDVQKKNDVLELEIKEKDSKLLNFNKNENDENNLNKLLQEKESLLNHLQEENSLYKDQLNKIKEKLLNDIGVNNLETKNISNQIDKLNNEYLAEIIKYKQIINKYLTYENSCSRKWNELLLANDTLKEKVKSLNSNWESDIKKYNLILKNNDIRLQSALEKISQKVGGGFDLKKEEAAKFLVEQMNICLEEKTNFLKENSLLRKNNTELLIENDKLKNEVTELEINKRNGDNRALLSKIDELKDVIRQKSLVYDPEKIINYENVILNLDIQNKQKDSLIQEYKNKMDNFLKNNTFLNFDDREVVNSVSRVLNQKDQVIQSLKNKIIDNELNEQKK